MLEILKAIIFGIVEGITEWLPISSTGHLILLNEFLKLEQEDAFFEMFQVVIQLGAILAVIVIYFHKLNPFSPKKTQKQKMMTWQIWIKVLIGSVPAGVVGLLFNDWIDEKLYHWYVVAAMLIVYGILFIIVENYQKGKEPKVKYIWRPDRRYRSISGRMRSRIKFSLVRNSHWERIQNWLSLLRSRKVILKRQRAGASTR